MKSQKPTVNYDDEVDILTLSKHNKVKHSIRVGMFIIDIDFDGLITGVEILDASKTLRADKNTLKSVKEASMIANYKPDFVTLTLVILLDNREKDVTIPLQVPLNHRGEKIDSAKFAVV